MAGMKVKKEVDMWGHAESEFSQIQGSDQQQNLLYSTIKDEVQTDQDTRLNPEAAEQPHIEEEEQLRIKEEEEELSDFPLNIIAVKTEDAEDTFSLPCQSPAEAHDDETDRKDREEPESDTYGNSSDTEDSMIWDREQVGSSSTRPESDNSVQTDNDEQASNSEDWIQKWKVDDDVCYPAHTKSNKSSKHLSTSDEGTTEEHKCSECGKTFTDKLYLKRHMIRHTGRRPYTCLVCMNSFTQNAHLRKHMRSHTGEKPFNCPLCDATFSLKQNLQRHMTIHSGEKSFSCPICQKAFTQKCHLSRHMSLHLGEKQCGCSDETCEHTTSLNGQQLGFSGEKPFSCPFCSKGFTRKDHLTSHLSTHTGDKQFDCPECDAKFNLKQSLERHMTVHSGEKPFSCPDCKKGFTRNSTLKLHMRTHTGEKPFSCAECKAKFNRKENFLRHLTVHTGARPFSCSVCKKDFTRKPSLEKHMKSHSQQ